MYFAALGHIHGNLRALEAVLDVLDDEGIQTVFNTGDSVVGHAMANEVVELLRSRHVISVLGEGDRRAVHFLRKRATLQKKYSEKDFAALENAFESLRPENIEYLRSLPRARNLVVEGLNILLCHGTPANPAATLSETDNIELFRRQRELAAADIIIGGGTHEAYSREVDMTLFVSPGTVGGDADGDSQATYAVIDTEVQPWATRFFEIQY